MSIKTKNKIINIFVLVICGVLASNPYLVVAQQDSATGKDPEVQDIAQQIKKQQEAIEDLQEKISSYEKKIQSKRNEALSIKNQLEDLSDNISQTKLEIELSHEEIKGTELKIASTEKTIKEKEDEILSQKEKISEFIRILYKTNQKNSIEILLSNDAFSEFFDQTKHLETVEGDLAGILKKLNIVKDNLDKEKIKLSAELSDLKTLKETLTSNQISLEEKVTAKNVILEATEADEAKFQALLVQVRAEQAQINSEIVSLEKALRAKLEKSGDKTLSDSSGQAFIWPVPSKYVTSGFHDPDYPFRRYFEHPAIDIRAKQGTSIKAVASGYVSKTRDAGLGYSYISIIHADGLSSVYGHVSCILVSEDEYVVQGQVIGCSGGTPGTPGAGNLTTGPHLHLEVRLNGIPVNPLNYLP